MGFPDQKGVYSVTIMRLKGESARIISLHKEEYENSTKNCVFDPYYDHMSIGKHCNVPLFHRSIQDVKYEEFCMPKRDGETVYST